MACGARLPLGFESDTDVRSGSRSYGDAGKGLASVLNNKALCPNGLNSFCL